VKKQIGPDDPAQPTVLDSIHALVAAARRRLRSAEIPDAESDLDARLLAERLLGWDTAVFFTHAHETAPPGFADRYQALIERRADREPVAYISGLQEFWGLGFEVNPAVLIPRPETELIVEVFLEYFAVRDRAVRVADVCTGSGCLAVAIASERPAAEIVATDISDDALVVARRNALRHHAGDRITLVKDDVLSQVEGEFDAIVANPPYIPDDDIDTLQPEVRGHEPRIALAAGADGLDVVRTLVSQSGTRLKPSGLLLFEFGFGQAAAVTKLIVGTPGLTLIDLRRDLQGIPRTAVVKKADRQGSSGPENP
jgi:release factor glutamine methyltransferase